MNKLILILVLFCNCILAQKYDKPKTDSFLYNGLFYYSFNENTQLSDWVGYTLKSDNIDGDAVVNKFYSKDSLVVNSPEVDEFYNCGYHLLQLYPQADAKSLKQDINKTLILSNILPMDYKVYEEKWRVLENMVRGWTMIFDSVHVITGPIYNSDNPVYMSNDKIRVPDKFFKAILVYNGIDMVCAGFIMNNIYDENKVEKTIYSIDSLEIITGYNFFSELPDYVEYYLEQQVDLPLLKNLSYSYGLKSSYNEDSRCVATMKSGARCEVITDCISKNCWKHGCDLIETEW